MAGNRALCTLLASSNSHAAQNPVVQRVAYSDGAIDGEPFKRVEMTGIEIASGDNADDRRRGLCSAGASGCAMIFVHKPPNELYVAHCVAASMPQTRAAEPGVVERLLTADKIVLVYGDEYTYASESHLAAELMKRAGKRAKETYTGYNKAAMRTDGSIILDPEFKDDGVINLPKKKDRKTGCIIV